MGQWRVSEVVCVCVYLRLLLSHHLVVGLID